MSDDEDDTLDLSLGPCCVCETHTGVTNIVMLNIRAPTPGTGWGCDACGLPPDGAIAVMCGGCIGLEPRFVCDGFAKDRGRIPMPAVDQRIEFDHVEGVVH